MYGGEDVEDVTAEKLGSLNFLCLCSPFLRHMSGRERKRANSCWRCGDEQTADRQVQLYLSSNELSGEGKKLKKKNYSFITFGPKFLGLRGAVFEWFHVLGRDSQGVLRPV